jgi:hypothetical protein
MIRVTCYMVPCGLVNSFGGASCLHLQSVVFHRPFRWRQQLLRNPGNYLATDKASYSFRTLQKTHGVSITKTSWFLLLGE